MNMKTSISAIVLLLSSSAGWACDLCKAKQPKGLENITHGQGPTGNMDYVIMYSAIVMVGYALVMSVWYLIRPKEQKRDRIKNSILDDLQ